MVIDRNRMAFPTDLVDPVGKGELGADVVQQVNGSIGQAVGIILWESNALKHGAMVGSQSCVTISGVVGPTLLSLSRRRFQSISSTSIW